MAQENQKDLVMKDLCGRLPYRVYVQVVDRVGYTHTRELTPEDIQKMWSYKSIKPYLRPMSSMTEEEILELYKIAYITWYSNSLYYKNEEWITFKDSIQNNTICFKSSIWLSNINKVIEWLNAHHFDYRGLIPKDLALSTDEFNPYED